ncbi:MAG: response regulator [Acidobacteriota bacterium]|nr:response regulator [Acidobacteriota bacterium]
MPLEKRRVLCVDDNEDTLFILTRLLEQEGFDVSTAVNSELALELASLASFDLYILDTWFPDGSGITLRESDPMTPIIVYSGAAYLNDRVVAINAGATAFVPKPYVEELLDTIGRLPEVFES